MRRIIFTTSGNPHRGSWIIRGQQIAAALDAEAIFEATEAEIAKADLVVVVKKASDKIMARIRKRGVPWVLDVLDGWPQPQGNAWSAKQAIGWLRGYVGKMAATGLVCATEAMAKDLADCGPTLTLYHHARPGQKINPIREEIRAVGYEGSARYLEGWKAALESECRARGWALFINPPSLAEIDIVLALRGGQWAGPACERWKSNVKLANAQGSGTPIICQPDQGYIETASGGEWWITSPAELARQFSGLSSADERRRCAQLMRSRAPDLETIATRYRQWLDTL